MWTRLQSILFIIKVNSNWTHLKFSLILLLFHVLLRWFFFGKHFRSNWDVLNFTPNWNLPGSRNWQSELRPLKKRRHGSAWSRNGKPDPRLRELARQLANLMSLIKIPCANLLLFFSTSSVLRGCCCCCCYCCVSWPRRFLTRWWKRSKSRSSKKCKARCANGSTCLAQRPGN